LKFDDKDVQSCLDKAREIGDQYRMYVLNGAHILRSVDDLRWICSQYLEKNITFRNLEVPAHGKPVKGLYIALNDDTYEIYLLAGLDRIERRFILCKELFHVLLDEEGCCSTSIYDHLEEVTTTFPLPNGSPNRPAAWEALAEAAAMEFLFPFKEREALFVPNAGPDVIATASARYEIPSLYIESYCTDKHMEYFKRFEPTVA
jgi:hypothetical protein